jgi:hypothetical protein
LASNTNGQCVEKCRQTIASIDWFANVGSDFDLELPMPVSRVKTWGAATRKANSLKWENTTLEARNDMTSWLSSNHRDLYTKKWSEFINRHKEQTVSPLQEQVWGPFLEKLNLNPKLVHSIRWDILHVLMEASYRDLIEHEFDFSGQLLRVYAAGHFPCGWKGRYPGGTLIVF